MKLTLGYILHQDAGALAEPMAGLNDPGVMRSFHTGLVKAREHLVKLLTEAQPGGSHEMLCYHFQVGTSLLMAILDGMAVFVEKKVAETPTDGNVYWERTNTFLDPRFAELKAIKDRTAEYIIKGGITVNSLRNLAKHYLPWVPLSDCSGGTWDIRFPLTQTDKSGPVIKGLLLPVFNDAVAAYAALGKLINQDVIRVHTL